MRALLCELADALLEPLDRVCGLVGVVAISLRCVSGRTRARDMFDTSSEVVEARDPGGIVAIVVIVVIVAILAIMAIIAVRGGVCS